MNKWIRLVSVACVNAWDPKMEAYRPNGTFSEGEMTILTFELPILRPTDEKDYTRVSRLVEFNTPERVNLQEFQRRIAKRMSELFAFISEAQACGYCPSGHFDLEEAALSSGQYLEAKKLLHIVAHAVLGLITPSLINRLGADEVINVREQTIIDPQSPQIQLCIVFNVGLDVSEVSARVKLVLDYINCLMASGRPRRIDSFKSLWHRLLTLEGKLSSCQS